jgi:hypothetical protein
MIGSGLEQPEGPLAHKASAQTALDLHALSAYRESAGVVVDHGYYTGLSSRRADRYPSVSRGLAEGFFFACLAGGGRFRLFRGRSRA